MHIMSVNHYDSCSYDSVFITLIHLPKKREMKKNMGSTDRTIRIVAAIIFAILYFTHVVSGTLGIVLLVLAAVFVLTSFVSFCPLYAPFGINTCPMKDQK